MSENVPFPEGACFGSQNNVSRERMEDTRLQLREMNWPDVRWGGWEGTLICHVKSKHQVTFQSHFNLLFHIADAQAHQSLWTADSKIAEGKPEQPTPPWWPPSAPSSHFPNTCPPSGEIVWFENHTGLHATTFSSWPWRRQDEDPGVTPYLCSTAFALQMIKCRTCRSLQSPHAVTNPTAITNFFAFWWFNFFTPCSLTPLETSQSDFF